MESTFELNWRRQQELAARPLIDRVYRMVLHPVSVRRFDNEQSADHVLDRTYGIDAELTLTTGQVLTVQEKALSFKYATENTVTVEYMQDAASGEQGDWFRLYADLIFGCYLNENSNGLVKWIVLDVPALKIATARQHIRWEQRSNRCDNAHANFRYTRPDSWPVQCRKRCILWESGFCSAVTP